MDTYKPKIDEAEKRLEELDTISKTRDLTKEELEE
jgi:hypothetical protein